MKRYLLFILIQLMSLSVFALEANINGLWYELVTHTNEAKVCQYKNGNNYRGDIIIPETLEYEGVSYKVTSIKNGAFIYCTGLTSVKIGNSVTNIGREAFRCCNNLTTITLHDEISQIDDYTFWDCTSLKTVYIGKGVKTINYMAFANCSELTDVYCFAENVPSTNSDAFKDSYIESVTLHVPINSISTYQNAEPWKQFKNIIAINGTTHDTQKCATPIILYNNNKLIFYCETDDVEYVSEITDTDIKKNYTSEVDLTATYNIKVYATKEGYENSETATATLCWIDVDPQTEGITNGVSNVRAKAIMIQNTDSQLTVSGFDDGTNVNVYNLNGTLVGSAISHNCSAIVNSSLRVGSAAIVKVGDRSIKVVLK